MTGSQYPDHNSPASESLQPPLPWLNQDSAPNKPTSDLTLGSPPHEDQEEKPRDRRFVVLVVTVAVLAAAVIGLAVGIGIQTSRLYTASSGNFTASSGNFTTEVAPLARPVIDYNCSTNSAGVIPYIGKYDTHVVFSVYCSLDTPDTNILNIITPNFESCMDACSNYRSNVATGSKTCGGVSFIPQWVNATAIVQGWGYGNCYLKRGPLTAANLTRPPSDYSPVHSGIVNDP